MPLSAWNKFWFEKQSPAPMAIFRILLGLFILQLCFSELLPNFLCFFGVHGLIDTATMSSRWWQNLPIFNMFLLLPQSDFYHWVFFFIFILFAFFLTIGFCTRLSSFIVFLCLLSFDRQCPFILDGGDDFMRFTAFFVMLSPAGEAYSVDSLLLKRKNEQLKTYSPWAQRMLQIQISIAYFYAFIWKITGLHWQQGVAVYYASKLQDFSRFSLPWLTDYSPGYQFLTYYTLFVEFALGTLVWFKPLRYWVLLSGLILHAGIDFTMNLPCFEWLFVSSYITFIEPNDLEKVLNKIKTFIKKLIHYLPPLFLQLSVSAGNKLVNLLLRLGFPIRTRINKETEPVLILILLAILLPLGSWLGFSTRTRLNNYEKIFSYERRIAKAQNHWQEILNSCASLPDNDERKLSAQEALATILSLTPDYPSAAALLRHVCKERTEEKEAYNAKLVRSLSTLGDIYLETGHLNAAELCYRTILNYDRGHLSNSAERLAIDLNNLGVIYYFRGLSENKTAQLNNFQQAGKFFTAALQATHQKSTTLALRSLNESDFLANQYLLLRDIGSLEEANKIKQQLARLSSGQQKLTMP